MTTLAANTPRDREIGDIGSYPIIANDTVYDGAAVGDNGSGYARPLVAGDPFLGFCYSKCDNEGGAAAAKYVDVWKRGAVKLSVSGAAITDVGRPVYATDDNTFVFAGPGPSGSTFIGRVVRYVSSGVVIVEFDAQRMKEQLIDCAFGFKATAAATTGDWVTTWTPGFAGRVVKTYFVGEVVGTAYAGVVNLEIGTTDLTGGAITLTTTTGLAKASVATGTAITAGNAFTATDTISVEITSNTTDAAGSGTIHVVLGR